MQISEQAAVILANHKKQLDDIQANMQYGDWVKVCEKTNLSKTNAFSAFKRINSKHHALVVATLKQIIQERLENLKSL